MNVVAQGSWLAATRTRDVVDLWQRDCPELMSLTSKIDALFEAWLKLVAPKMDWDAPGQALRAEPSYDGYIPDEQVVRGFRTNVIQALDRFRGDWRGAELADLVNYGLELEVASYLHAQKPTRQGIPDFAKPKGPKR